MKQRKIQHEESPQTEEQIIIAQILNVCVFAKQKDDIEMMLSSLRAELRGHAYNINAKAIIKLSAMIGQTEAVTKRKLKALCANGYMQLDHEQYVHMLPKARVGVTETQCAEALLKYQNYLLAPITKQARGKTAAQLLDGLCPARGGSRDAKLCALQRYPECADCKWVRKE